VLENVPLPTDNLYKMAFFLGLALLGWSAVPIYRMYQVEVQKERLSGEIENLNNRQAWLKEDSDAHNEAVSRLRKEKQGKWQELPRIDPNSQDYATFLEATGRKGEIGGAQPPTVFWIDAQRMITASEEKRRIIQETQDRLATAEKELVKTARDIAISHIQLRAKCCENGEVKRFIQSQRNLGIVMAIAGLSSLGFGAYNWRTKTQKYQDAIKETETKSGKEESAGAHASG
jgi:hypothetical protein